MTAQGADLPHILIIDDDPDQLRLLVSALRSAYRVSIALNGDQGYARATALLPNIILLDLSMPGRNGITVARLLKNNHDTANIPIIFVSSFAETDERVAGLRAGAVDYIRKPLSVEETLERVRIHLALSQDKPKLSEPGSRELLDQASARTQSVDYVFRQVATEFIANNFHDSDLRGADIAERLGISIRRLNAIFELYDGLSTFEFIRQERMRRAALLLTQSVLTITDVAAEVGYANPANFSTEFRKFWGKPPSHFRTASELNINR